MGDSSDLIVETPHHCGARFRLLASKLTNSHFTTTKKQTGDPTRPDLTPAQDPLSSFALDPSDKPQAKLLLGKTQTIWTSV